MLLNTCIYYFYKLLFRVLLKTRFQNYIWNKKLDWFLKLHGEQSLYGW